MANLLDSSIQPTDSFAATIKRVPWLRVLGAWLTCLAVGVALAFGIKALGWWGGGAWEVAVIRWIGRYQSASLDKLMLGVSFVGTNYTMALPIAIAAALLWRRGHRLAAIMLVTVIAGSWSMHPLLKYTLVRGRPEVLEHRNVYMMMAYPSGHSVSTMSVLFVVAWLLQRYGYGWGFYILAALLAATNGYSRMYNGVHWPTDILAGGILGAMWFFFLTLIFRRLVPLRGDR